MTEAASEKTKGRARLTNRRGSIFPISDGRSISARIMKDALNALLSHLGGADYASEPQRIIARRVAAWEAELIFLEDSFAQARADGEAPEASSLDLYTRMASAQRRHLEALGLQRVPRDITPDPLDYARTFDRRPRKEVEA